MKVWTTAAATLTLLAGLAIGTVVAPVAQGQVKTRVVPRKVTQVEPLVQVIAGSGRLGVSVRNLGEDDAKGAKLAASGGVMIDEVVADSPAEKAGFKTGDIVVEFDGERVRSTRQFTRLVQETPPDRQVQAVVVRDGQRTTLSVSLQASDSANYFRDWQRFDLSPRVTPPKAPAPPALPRFEHFPNLETFISPSGRLGITVDTLSEQLAGYFGTKEGVLVTSVTVSSAGGKAGIKAGDVITSLNGNPVSSASELTRRIQRMEDGDEFSLEIVRDKKAVTVKGKLEPRQQRRWTTSII